MKATNEKHQLSSVVLVCVVFLHGCAAVPGNLPTVTAAELDTPLTVVQKTPVRYSEIWQRSRINNEALVSFTINHDGRTTGIVILRTTKKEFGDFAIKAVQGWRFSPPKNRGKPCVVEMKVPVIQDLDSTDWIMADGKVIAPQIP